MSFLLSLFRSPEEKETPLASRDDTNNNNDNDNSDNESDNGVLQPPVVPHSPSLTTAHASSKSFASIPPMPSRQTSGMNRDRSFSKVFNQLPPHLPTLQEMQMDLMEYLCHLILLQTNVAKALLYKTQLTQVLESHQIHKYGRFYSRLNLTALGCDLLCLPESETPETWTTPQDWAHMREQLVLTKSLLLRRDANVWVPTAMEESESPTPAGAALETTPSLPQPNDAIDHQLETHEMFQDTYQQVYEFVHVQEIIARLRLSLQEVIVTPDENDDRRIPRAREAVELYQQQLGALFHGPEHIPKDLTHFLLRDLYRNHHDWIRTVPTHLEELILHPRSVFSLAKLQQKVRSLLIKWSESILEIPTLVKIGYGGVMAPVVGDDGDDDVSAWGDDDEHAPTAQELLTQPPPSMDEAHEPLPASTRPLNQRSSVTIEDAETLKQLVLAPPPHRTRTRVTTTTPSQRPTPSKDLRRVARQNVRREQELLTQPEMDRGESDHDRSDEEEKDDDVEHAQSEGEKENDPDERKILTTLSREQEERLFEDSSTDEEEEPVRSTEVATRDNRQIEVLSSSQKRKRHPRVSTSPATPVKGRSTENKLHKLSRWEDSDVEEFDALFVTEKQPLSGHKKRPFSSLETASIRHGVRQFGMHSWAQIRDTYPALSSRSGQQIRDKFRTMTKHGQA